MKLGAVILAAGAGTRLGGVAKALLPARGGPTFLAQIVATTHQVGVELLFVVVGQPFASEVGDTAGELGATVIVNPQPQRGMASSVALGFGTLHSVGACDAAWLWPVDHPYVSADTLRQLIAALMNHDAARPVYSGRGGHPPLIARPLFSRLAQCADVDGGARSVLAAADTIDVPVDDAGCVRDIDTPADLEAV